MNEKILIDFRLWHSTCGQVLDFWYCSTNFKKNLTHITEAENSGSVTGSWLQGITVHISRNYNFFYKFKKLVYHNVEITDSPMGEIQNDHSDYQSISNDQQSFEESATFTKNLSYQLLEVSYI